MKMAKGPYHFKIRLLIIVISASLLFIHYTLNIDIPGIILAICLFAVFWASIEIVIIDICLRGMDVSLDVIFKKDKSKDLGKD